MCAVASDPSRGPQIATTPSVRTNPVLLATPAPIIPVTPVALTQGTRLGPHEIVAPSRAGGRGEVYNARDTRLDLDPGDHDQRGRCTRTRAVKPDRWSQVSQLYHAALAQDANERGRFLAQACEGDDALQREVESLLAHEGAAEGFLAAPALEVAAKVMAEDAGGSLSGRQIGGYQILSRLGAGGMGEVYRARDTKLGRDVAFKVLPRAFTADPDRLARFEREARVLASLNHPHIGAIYGVEDSDGVRALVLELVEGETLADRLVQRRAAARPGAAHRDPDRERARHGASRGHRPSRPQARQHHAHAERRRVRGTDGQAARLRAGEGQRPGGRRRGSLDAADDRRPA